MPYGYAETANSLNNFMGGQALSQYNANLPGYANAVGTRAQTTQQLLQGQLPQDVINQIAQQSSERGISGGNPGSANANAAYLRALGLNSMQAQQQGSQQLSQSIADTPTAELWNPASLWVPSTLGVQQTNAAQAGQANAYSLTQLANQDAVRKAQSVAWNSQGGSQYGWSPTGSNAMFSY